jgi:hypothetical protein
MHPECSINPQDELGAPQAVQPQIPVKIAVECDGDTSLQMGMQLPNQIPQEAVESCTNLATGFLPTGYS